MTGNEPDMLVIGFEIGRILTAVVVAVLALRWSRDRESTAKRNQVIAAVVVLVILNIIALIS